jgi:hypothetical protein
MSFQFISIEGDIALLLDTERGVVLRMPVEDYTGGAVETPRVIAPRRRVVQETIAEDTPPESEALVPIPAPVVRHKRRSIMPPDLRSVLLPIDTPGAATERRMV